MLISTALGHGMASVQTAGYMRDAGFDAIDLSMCDHQTEPEYIQTSAWSDAILADVRAAKSAGLTVGQCHLPFYPGHLPLPGDGSIRAFADFMLPGYLRGLELCNEAECPVAVMHPFFSLKEPSLTKEGNLYILEKLLPTMEKYHVAVALENVYGHDGNYLASGVHSPEGILSVLNDAPSPLIGACIDTGHANIFRIPIPDMARKYGKRLLALHVNGNAGKDEHAIPYTMSGWCEEMDYHAFSRALGEIGYAGTYNLEIAVGAIPPSAVPAYYALAAAVARALAEETGV